MKTRLNGLRAIIAASMAVAVASCIDTSAPRATSALPDVRNDILGLTFLACTPMTADSVSQSVDSTGGTINVGPHQLVIPAGALDTAVTITAVAPSDTVNRVQLYPEGLQFAKKASLAISYANCSPISSLFSHRVAYVDSSFNILDLIPSLDNLLAQQVTAKLHHFSDYVVAW